jgi:hypothetical protein
MLDKVSCSSITLPTKPESWGIRQNSNLDFVRSRAINRRAVKSLGEMLWFQDILLPPTPRIPRISHFNILVKGVNISRSSTNMLCAMGFRSGELDL